MYLEYVFDKMGNSPHERNFSIRRGEVDSKLFESSI